MSGKLRHCQMFTILILSCLIYSTYLMPSCKYPKTNSLRQIHVPHQIYLIVKLYVLTYALFLFFVDFCNSISSYEFNDVTWSREQYPEVTVNEVISLNNHTSVTVKLKGQQFYLSLLSLLCVDYFVFNLRIF